MHRSLIMLVPVAAWLVGVSTLSGADPEPHIGHLGPTGLEVAAHETEHLKIISVASGSPAQGLFEVGQLITAINGRAPIAKEGNPRAQVAQFITEAEASDGVLKFTVAAARGAAKEVTLRLPVLGAYSATSPIDCPKTRKIIQANAAFLRAKAGEDGTAFVAHNLHNGWAILMLLSTGQEEDLQVVRKIYRTRMAQFTGTDTGPHSWHNGLQGIAVCEYYLRTGDESVMPLINAICESARKYEVQGGWTHWATGVNPQYTAGGLLNAAGTQLLTTLLLAKQCGAKVDEQTLLDSLTFFYRFVGHGANPYGDHRPEGGYGSNNGKTEMIALAMNVASRATNGEVYALARDKSASHALYSYPHILQGHTGGYGALWYGVSAALMREKKPELYANWVEQTRWFFELSRRHSGAFWASGSGRYDEENFGYAVGLGLTAPLKTLQITGAPTSPYAKPFELPQRPWGRPADLAFFTIDGGPAYTPTNDPPHLEMRKIADADEAGLRRLASHPEYVYREKTAAAIAGKKLSTLIESLLESPDPLARHTGCMAINTFNPWFMRGSIGLRSAQSLDPAAFTPRMLEGLMKIINDPEQPLWSVDQALLALVVASPEQIESRLDELLPWFEHEEWWLNEATCIAVSPAMATERTLDRILPHLIESVARCVHARGRGTMQWYMKRAVEQAEPSVKLKMNRAFLAIYEKTPSVPSPEPGVDHSGITSFALNQTLLSTLSSEPEVVLAGARLSVGRLGDMRVRERDEQIEALVNVGQTLDEAGRRQIGQILHEHYRQLVVGDDPAALKQALASGQRNVLDRTMLLVKIDELAGKHAGWRLLGNNASGQQEWWHTSFDPQIKPPESEFNRWRKVEFPERLTGWFQPDYDPAQHGWTQDRAVVGKSAAQEYKPSERWLKELLPAAGEVVLTRKTFELEDLNDVAVRVTVYAKQGFEVYLNGQRIISNTARSKTWSPQSYILDDKMRQHLKAGRNVLTAVSFLEYFRGKNGNIDVYIEALRDWPRVD